MKIELNVVGLDCANCALTLEKYLQTIENVNDCIINFATSKVYMDLNEIDYKATLKKVYKLAKQVNPDVRLSIEKNDTKTFNYIELVLFVVGFILGATLIVCSQIFKVDINIYLYYILLLSSALLMGYKTYYKAIIQLRHLKINENTLVTISIFGAIALGETMEGLMVIALYTIGKMLEAKAVNYSRKSIAKLISNQPEYAVILIGDEEKKVKPSDVKVDDIIIAKPGEKVALDGVILEGGASVDKKHLTGESLPVFVEKNSIVEAGSIVLDSVIKLKVIKEYKDSTVSKILNMINDANNKKSKTETFVSKFASVYTLCVIVVALIVSGITMLVLKDWSVAIYRGLIFLVVSCPCAFAISVPLSYFSGIGKCSSLGILVKGSNCLDVCANLKQVVFDKTGTLTTGSFQIKNIEIIDSKIKEQELMQIVVAGEQNSLHPIAIAICDYWGKKSKIKIAKFKEVAGKGIEFCVDKDKYSIMRSGGDNANTIVEVAKNSQVIGKIYLEDKIKENSQKAIEDIKSMGVKTSMLTGDNEAVASYVASQIGIDEYRAELYPDDKFKIIEEMRKDSKIAFVGDGINDAPALTLADVGISMGTLGSDATIEASDVVVADDNISKIATLINMSKFTKKIVWQNIAFAGVIKLAFLALGAIGITGMFFAVLADVGVTILTIFNSLRILNKKIK